MSIAGADLQTIEELPSGNPGIGVKPRFQSGGHGLQRIWDRPHFASRPPGDLEALEECVERRRVAHGGGHCIGDLNEGLLGRANVPEQAHGIERRMLRVQRVLHRLRRARIGDEALVRRQRRMIPLADQPTFPLFLGEPE